MKIRNIIAQEIFDSRGIPTIECTIILEDTTKITASVPSGISRSSYEAVELRDGGDRLMGLGVQDSVAIIEKIINPTLIGREPDISAMDQELLMLDGTENKSRLGANTLLAVSIALCKAQAHILSLPLYQFIAQIGNYDQLSLPIPLFNFFGGGLHANNNFPIQELLIVPLNAPFEENIDLSVSLYHHVQKIIKDRGKSIAVGYEGEFVPFFSDEKEPFDIIMGALDYYNCADKVMIALDVAASTFYNNKTGLYTWHGKEVTAQYLIEFYQGLAEDYPLYSIEDGLAEDDWDSWELLKKTFADQVKIIGDDIFATNPQRILKGIQQNVADGAIIKPNQIGTVSEALEAIKLCKKNDWDIVISHRSGETNDSFIADLAVGVGAHHIKAGGCSRGERMAKYNRLLHIERKL